MSSISSLGVVDEEKRLAKLAQLQAVNEQRQVDKDKRKQGNACVAVLSNLMQDWWTQHKVKVSSLTVNCAAIKSPRIFILMKHIIAGRLLSLTSMLHPSWRNSTKTKQRWQTA